MYRLTLEEKHAAAWRIENEGKAKRVKQRVYRWAQYWGTLRADEPFETQWRIETRIPLNIGSSSTLLQRIEPVTDIQNPPVNVDDIWDEELLVLPTGESCNTLLYITGDKECILKACGKYGISSTSLEQQEQQEQEQQTTAQLAITSSTTPSSTLPQRPLPVSRDSSRGGSQHRGTTWRPQDPTRVHERPRNYEGAPANPRAVSQYSHGSDTPRGQRGRGSTRGRGFTHAR